MNKPSSKSRLRRPSWPGALAVAAVLAACAGRAPVLVPPSSGVEAVEGFGSASMHGEGTVVKGKFAFLFRRPGLGRVEAVDPLGRTVFVILFREDRAYFDLPGKKIYAEEGAAAMMERFLGLSLLPDEALGLLGGTGPDAAQATGWRLERDDRGRVTGGDRDGFAFTVREFFPGADVPREIGISGPGSTGRMKVLKLGFNPAPREGTFDASFLRTHTLKTWDEIRDILDR